MLSSVRVSYRAVAVAPTNAWWCDARCTVHILITHTSYHLFFKHYFCISFRTYILYCIQFFDFFFLLFNFMLMACGRKLSVTHSPFMILAEKNEIFYNLFFSALLFYEWVKIEDALIRNWFCFGRSNAYATQNACSIDVVTKRVGSSTILSKRNPN